MPCTQAALHIGLPVNVTLFVEPHAVTIWCKAAGHSVQNPCTQMLSSYISVTSEDQLATDSSCIETYQASSKDSSLTLAMSLKLVEICHRRQTSQPSCCLRLALVSLKSHYTGVESRPFRYIHKLTSICLARARFSSVGRREMSRLSLRACSCCRNCRSCFSTWVPSICCKLRAMPTMSFLSCLPCCQ